MEKQTKNGRGEGSYRRISKEGEPEKWTGRKQFGYKPDGKPNIKAVYGASETICRKLMKAYEKQYESINVNASKRIFGEYLMEWFELYKKPKLKRRTYDTMKSTINSRFLQYPISKYQLSQLNSDVIQYYINQLATESRIGEDDKVLPPYSRESIKKIYNLIHNCLSHALSKQLLATDPMEDTFIPSEESLETKAKEIEFFDDEDMPKVYDECLRKFSNNAYVYGNSGLSIALLLCTGLRVGEGLALTYADIDRKDKVLHVTKALTRVVSRNPKSKTKYEYIITTPKSKSSNRDVPLSDKALYVIDEFVKNNINHEPSDFLMVTKTGNHITDRNIRRTLNSIQETIDTKIKNSGIHVLRHTFCTMMIDKGIPINVVSVILGHKKPSTTTDIYSHVLEKQKRKAIDIFDQLNKETKK